MSFPSRLLLADIFGESPKRPPGTNSSPSAPRPPSTVSEPPRASTKSRPPRARILSVPLVPVRWSSVPLPKQGLSCIHPPFAANAAPVGNTKSSAATNRTGVANRMTFSSRHTARPLQDKDHYMGFVLREGVSRVTLPISFDNVSITARRGQRLRSFAVLTDYNKADEDTAPTEHQEQRCDERGAHHGEPGPRVRRGDEPGRRARGRRPAFGRVRRAGGALRSGRAPGVLVRALRDG